MLVEKRLRIHPELRHRSRELRHPQTSAEECLWSALRNRHLEGYKFRRQHPLGQFIVDFYCAQTRLVVEIDGDGHTRQIEYDAMRTEWLESQGFTVIRFWNEEVMDGAEVVATQILEACTRLEKGGVPHE
jgi:very-short-patch-repair endonuclease